MDDHNSDINGQFVIPNTPEDYISDLLLADLPGLGTCLLVTAWDGTLSIYKTTHEAKEGNDMATLIRRKQHRYPLLSCCLAGSNIYVGSVQGELLEYDLQINDFIPVINKDGVIASLGICKIFYYQNQEAGMKSIVCGSWDGSINVIDMDSNRIESTIRLDDDQKILSMDCDSQQIIVAETGNKLKWYTFPLTGNDQGVELDSALKYQIRDVKLLPNGKGYVLSSMDGRVAVEYFNDESKQFAFRCHRMNLTDTQFVFPVNTLAFTPNELKLFTGGSDGTVSYWNLETRRKIRQFKKFDSNSVIKLVSNERFLFTATSDDSFKTNAIISDYIELQPSNIYAIPL